VVDNVEIVVSGVVVAERVVVFAVVTVEVSEENVALRGEGRGVVSDSSEHTSQGADHDHISGFRGRGYSDRRGDGERSRGRGRGRGRGGE
jgi:hypothetical protein